MTRPNIIVIILDCVRARNMSCYGYPKKTTPYLDAFAAENILFRRAFTTSTWTIPTHASLLTGLYLSQHRIENTQANRCFNARIVTLPEVLRQENYRTVAFSQNVLFSPQHHLGSFDEFFLKQQLQQVRPFDRLINRWSLHAKGTKQRVAQYWRKALSLRLVLNEMRSWIDRQEGPFFMMVNLANVHYPWAPALDILLRGIGLDVKYLLRQEFLTLAPWVFNAGKQQVTNRHRRMWLTLYNAALSHVDREVGRFLSDLRSWRGWENTIVAITADHGELMGEHRDIVGHMLCLHDNLVHVPLLLRHPNYPQGLKVEGVVQTLDLFPSILEWTSSPIDRVAPPQVQRPSLSAALDNPNNSGGIAFAEEDYTDSYTVLDGLRRVNPKLDLEKHPRQQIMIHSATHKYIWHDTGPGEFYHLENDPNEMHNLIHCSTNEQGAILTGLKQTLDEWRLQLKLFPPRPVDHLTEMSPETIKHLRSLGYVT